MEVKHGSVPAVERGLKNIYFICFSPWEYLSKMRHNLYDCFWDSSWKKLGYIYVWTSGGKTLCSVKINHFVLAPDLRPTDWLSRLRAWHTAIVGLNLRISSANLNAVRSASLSLFLHFLLQLMDWQLEATTICVPMSWGLLVSFRDASNSYCIRTKPLDLMRHLKHVGVVYMVLAWSNVQHEFRANLWCGCFSCTSKASPYDTVYFEGLVYSFYM